MNNIDKQEMIANTIAYLKASGIAKPTKAQVKAQIEAEHGKEVAKAADKPKAKGNSATVTAREGGSRSSHQGEPNDEPKAKTEKPAKKAKKASLKQIFGFKVAAVARALGKAEWMPADAIAAINSMVPKASPAAIRTYVQAGKAGVRGEPAPLTKDQLEQLKALVVVEA